MLSYDITEFSAEKPGDITAGNLQFAGTALDCVIGDVSKHLAFLLLYFYGTV